MTSPGIGHNSYTPDWCLQSTRSQAGLLGTSYCLESFYTNLNQTPGRGRTDQ